MSEPASNQNQNVQRSTSTLNPTLKGTTIATLKHKQSVKIYPDITSNGGLLVYLLYQQKKLQQVPSPPKLSFRVDNNSVVRHRLRDLAQPLLFIALQRQAHRAEFRI